MLILLGDRLSLQTQEIVHELVEHNESGIALEMMADMLAEGGAAGPLTGSGPRCSTSFPKMGMDDRVEQSLAQCPRRV